jgi:hypothetical protein
MGLLVPLSATTATIDYSSFAHEITGVTTSKLAFIKKSFAPGTYAPHVPITIRGTDIQAVVTEDSDDRVVYVLYYGSGLDITYTDENGITTYTFKPLKDTGYPENTAFRLKYWGIIDEPNLDTNLFISRGVNNVFESVNRLKTVANIQELSKTGFGFYALVSQ